MRTLGIDIGTTNIKAVELSGTLNNIILENYGILETYGYLERSNAAIQTNYFKLVEEITTELLRQLFSAFKPKTKRAFFSLPVFSSFITNFDLPFTNNKEIVQAVPFEAKKYIPLPLEELEINWMVIAKAADGRKEKSRIVLVATPKELIVDIGTQVTNLFVVDNTFLVNFESLNIGGAEITHIISQSLGVTQERAEEFKKIKGFKVNPEEMGVVNVLMPIVDNWE